MRIKNILSAALGLSILFGCQEQMQTQNTIEAVSVENMPALGPYSSAVKANGMLYVSGIIAFNAETKSFAPANIEAQTKQVFANLEKVLAAADCTLNDTVKITVYLKNPKDFPAMNIAYAPYFPGYKPARTTVPGVDWGRDDILIEIDVIAKLP